jgi:two-component system sensor histidine kinase/response regulator
MNASLRVLLIEDNPGDARLTISALSRLPPPIPEVNHLTSVQAAVVDLAVSQYDVILTDLDLPDSERLDTCSIICDASRGVPVVVLTGSHDDALGMEAIQLGAQDYLVKGHFHIAELWRVLHHARQRQQSLCALNQVNRDLEATIAQVRSLEKMREDLVHMIIHDLRSPVFIMRLYLESFLRDAGTMVPAHLLEDMAKTYDLSGELIEMVSSILDVSRIESAQMPMTISRCDLKQIIEEAIQRVASGANRTMIQVDCPDIHLECDPSLIRRTLANLVSNALRFSPAGKSVMISAKSLGQSIEVCVSDGGVGIPAEAQQRIFEKFGSIEAGSKGYSTGLGLPFCKIAIDMHGGTIGVHSQVDAGSTFWFTVPVSRLSSKAS